MDPRLEAFPFAYHSFHHADGQMRYVDEGRGPVMLFVHGTPDQSFGFRHLIQAFRGTHRCIAIDHLGFGESDKPVGADYSVAAHARRLQDFIAKLGLKDIVLVVTDFGGGIGLQHALEHPGNVRGIVLYNTWMWPLNTDQRFARPARLIRTALGRMLYLRFAFSVKVMMPMAYGDRRKLTKGIHARYKQAFPDPSSRTATYALAREILDAAPFWEKQWARIGTLQAIPTLICWGMKDSLVPPDLMQRWTSALPQARVHAMQQAGHFVHEESPNELIEAIRNWSGTRGEGPMPH